VLPTIRIAVALSLGLTNTWEAPTALLIAATALMPGGRISSVAAASGIPEFLLEAELGVSCCCTLTKHEQAESSTNADETTISHVCSTSEGNHLP